MKTYGSTWEHLQQLAEQLPHRCMGSDQNRHATAYLEEVLTKAGLHVEKRRFDCFHWERDGAQVRVGDITLFPQPSPWSLPWSGEAELDHASSIEELRCVDMKDKMLLVSGDLVEEQMMPKNFVFYNPEHHQEIISLLEAGQPRMILAATGKNPMIAGAIEPFPWIEDGDFDIPTANLSKDDGDILATAVGRHVYAELRSQRIPSIGYNITASFGDSTPAPILLSAHIDTKPDTPGALDNAAGVATLLTLAQRFAQLESPPSCEFIFFNGEDTYSVAGQMAYLADHPDLAQTAKLAVNLDALGAMGSKNQLSYYGCGEEVVAVTNDLRSVSGSWEEGDPWPQGDHMIFASQGIPAMAITSSNLHYLMSEITHTGRDTVDQVDRYLLDAAVDLLEQLVLKLDHHREVVPAS